MAAKSSIADIDAQIDRLRERRRMLIVKSAERFARAAIRSGLAELELADDEIERIVEEVAARFRKGQNNGVSDAAGLPPRPATGGTGTAAEGSHDG